MITKDIALTLTHRQILEHKTLKNKSDNSPLRCRVNGNVKTWKTRPNDFQLPVKYGMKECFYITQSNAHEWQIAK